MDRIGKLDDQVHAYVTILPEAAMEDARRAEAQIGRGEYRGPLHGIPVGLKDLYATKGARTTAHSRVLADWVPAEDATVVRRLREAGAVVLGKLAMSEFALGRPGPRPLFPPARNPWDLSRIPGGSSSGSGAAVAAGMCLGALGSDTGGSIRQPASYCGIVGLKPTYGRVSRQGVVPLAWTLDHCGPMARSVEDCALMLQALAGHDPDDPASSQTPVPDYSEAWQEDLRGQVIGVPRHFFFAAESDVDRQMLALVEQALGTLSDLGATVREVEIPSLAWARAANTVIMLTEAYAYHRKNLREHPQDYGPVRDQFLMGGLTTAEDYLQAERVRRLLGNEVARVLREVNVLVTPSFPTVAPTFEADDPRTAGRGFRFLGPFNLTGLPAMSVPCGFTPAGLPVGMQIAGRPFDEASVIRAGYAYQEATQWHERHPAL